MKIRKFKTQSILLIISLFFTACDFNSARERIVIPEEPTVSPEPETGVEIETEEDPQTTTPEPLPEVEIKKLVLLVYMAADNSKSETDGTCKL